MRAFLYKACKASALFSVSILLDADALAGMFPDFNFQSILLEKIFQNALAGLFGTMPAEVSGIGIHIH